MWAGNPGSGKTVLASFLVEELRTTDQSYVFYFFFRQAHPTDNHRAAVYRSLLCQIINVFGNDEEVLDLFLFAHETSPIGQTIATTNGMMELLQLCTSNLPGLTFLLDRIDECSESDLLLEDPLQLDSLSVYKFLLLSRRNIPQLSKMVANDQQKEMERNLVTNDIAKYLETQIGQFVEEKMLPESGDAPSLVEHMVQGADGMFLWATLMISYLKSPVLTPSRRVQTIMEIVMPEGLEAMYQRIIGLIQSHNKPERDLASQVLVWLTYAKQQLNAHQLRSIIMENEGDVTAQEHQAMDFIQIVAFVCGSLGESREVGGIQYIDFIHLSVREYFKQPGASSSTNQLLDSPIPPKEIANLYLTKVCFCELIRQPESKVGLSRPCTAYAVKYVRLHLSETRGLLLISSFSTKMEWEKNTQAMMQACRDFLRSPAAISTWIENVYRYGRFMSDDIHSSFRLDSVAAWAEWVDQMDQTSINLPSTEKIKSLVCDLKTFISDMQNLILHRGNKLESDPTLVWDEVSAFSKSQFFQPSFATTVSSLMPKQPDNIPASSRSLCTISSTSSDGTRTGVLSIWPSSAFKQCWGKLQSGVSLSSMLHLCSGWTATYEIWTEIKRRLRIQIFLEKDEISLLMRQSFREEFTNEWKTSFPLAISPSLTSFIILRTVFMVEASSCRSTKIDMSFLAPNGRFWDADLRPFEPQNEFIIGLPTFLRHLHHDWYSYRFIFSPAEKYILFSHFVYHSEEKP